MSKLLSQICVSIDSDGDGVCDDDDLDDDNDGILDINESCDNDDFIDTITPNGYDTQALQAGYHGALYKLVDGGYAITGFRALPSGNHAFTITEISTANGYTRAEDILLGTYGGNEGGAVFLLSNGDWACTPGFLPVRSTGWRIIPASEGPTLPEGVLPSDVKILKMHHNNSGAQFLLTILDNRGRLYYNGSSRSIYLPVSEFRCFLKGCGDPNKWEPFPDLPNGARVKSYDAGVGLRSGGKVVVHADDGNLYALGWRVNIGDGSPITINF